MELLAALIGIGAAFLFSKRKKKASYTVRPWGKNVLTLSVWDGRGAAMFADGVGVPAPRTLTAHEISVVRAGVDRWNSALSQAGVLLRVEIVTDPDPDILVFGSGGLKDRMSGHTVTWVPNVDAALQTVKRATIAIATPSIFAHELGHALGIEGHTGAGLMAAETRSIVPSVDDARLLLSVYGGKG